MAQDTERLITGIVLAQLAAVGIAYVPLAVSARHMHLTQDHISLLFGHGHDLTQRAALSQPGQFAAQEMVTFQGPKGEIPNIRVLGPARPETQVELSVTDCVKVGIQPVVRMSGDLADTPGGVLIGPAGRLEIPRGVMVARRHLHMSPSQAAAYGLKDGQSISVQITGARPGVLSDIPVRVGEGHWLDLHIDTDEANAFLGRTGDLVAVVPEGQKALLPQGVSLLAPLPAQAPTAVVRRCDLITEEVIKQASAVDLTQVICVKGGIITPAARDAARALRVDIVKE